MTLTLQELAGVISLVLSILVVMIFAYLIVAATKSEDKVTAKKKIYKVRGRYLWGLGGAVAVLFFISMQSLPYPSFMGTADKVVNVVAYQWAWKLAEGEATVDPATFDGTNDITLPANTMIQFNVTSADVNHNFAIYDSEGVLVAQTQAMPSYTNKLLYKFKQAGEYKVLCLEYCGLAHAFMVANIHVK
ncbi:MAG TPA: hypothetical protein PLE30_02970 [Candidatus Kapabacteria bacterium]|nr:hypothetical protein [Candidatus Kapabacteria bacterium]